MIDNRASLLYIMGLLAFMWLVSSSSEARKPPIGLYGVTIGFIVDNDTADHWGMAIHIPAVGGEFSCFYPPWSEIC